MAETNQLDLLFIPLQELKHHADALNIEGGLIPTLHFKSEKQVWANVAAVLDCPLHNDLDWDTLTQTNPYPLKESSLPDYNEKKVALAHAVLLKYYVKNAHATAKKSKEEHVTLVVQIHRGSSGKIQLDQMAQILSLCFPGQFYKIPSQSEIKNVKDTYYNKEKNITVEFRWGYMLDTIGNYDKAHIVISLSLVAGLKDGLISGSLVIPKTFVPMTIDTMTISKQNTYSAPNHVASHLSEILNEQTPELIDQINQLIKSPNPTKAHLKAIELRTLDFEEATLYEVDSIFVPKNLPDTVFKLDLAVSL